MIPRTANEPKLDAYISGIPQDAGLEIRGFRQFGPRDGELASMQTIAYVSYDDQNLYVVFVAKDDPSKIRSRIARREDIFGDDDVILELDTFLDKQRSYVFFVNPFGVQLDAKRTAGLPLDYVFDTQWKSEGKLTKDGYVAMLAIPFKSLRFPDANVQKWGIALGRFIARNNETSYWPYITSRQSAFIPQFAVATINEKISPGRNIQLIPHIILDKSKNLNSANPDHPFFERSRNVQAGLDAKFVIANSFALDLTVKPDFSEVESDEPQDLVNKRYEVLFPEKRPFFLENTGFFATPQPLFFSRRIIDPQYGARITGRSGSWSLGALIADDRAPGLLLDSGNKNFGKDSKVRVARIQNDIAYESNCGFLLTNRALGNSRNNLIAGDCRLRLANNWFLTGQQAKSKLQDSGNKDGSLSTIQVEYADREIKYLTKYLYISPNFNTDLGFIPRTDIKQFDQTIGRNWYFSNASPLQSFNATINGEYTQNTRSEVQDWFGEFLITLRTKDGLIFKGQASTSYEFFENNGFNKNGYSVSIESNLLKWISPFFAFEKNKVINYSPATGIKPFLGNLESYSLWLTLKPNDKLKIVEILYLNISKTDSVIDRYQRGAIIYRNLISRSKLNYQFDRFSAIRMIVDVNVLNSNNNLTTLGNSKRLNLDLQYNYSSNPGSAFYLGFTDLQENIELLGDPAIIKRTSNINLQTGRKVYIKYSKLFQL